MLSKNPCHLCPRKCGARRLEGERGFCGAGGKIRAARAMIHEGEEPCLIGPPVEKDKEAVSLRHGAGAVFFSGCSLRCVFCQNEEISWQNKGWEISSERLSEIFLELQKKGAQVIDLVTPAMYAPDIMEALERIRDRLKIPVVYNSGGYESVETLKALEGLVDIYLPDMKYKSSLLSARYSMAPDYFERAQEALREMVRQTGPCQLDDNGQMSRGTIVRHLVLPGCAKDSAAIMDYLGKTYGKNTIMVSLMRQYTPWGKARDYPEINRKVTSYEYEQVVEEALKWDLPGYRQQKSAMGMRLLPSFDGQGIVTL